MRKTGHIGEYAYELELAHTPSRFGIDGGRITKLWLNRDFYLDTVARYDHGWERLPTSDSVWRAVDAIIAEHDPA